MPGWIRRYDVGDLAERIGQVGWVARGISYVVLGVITMRLVIGTDFQSEDADQAGALVAVSDAPGGTILLVALAAGLAVFALWQAAQLTGISGSDPETWLERISKLIGIFFYGSLVLTAVELLRQGFSSESSWTVDRLSSWALDYPVGRIAIVIAGLIVVLISARRGRRTITGDLDDDLDLQGAGRRERLAVEWLGRIGEIGRAISFLIIGWFLVYAGLAGRSDAAGGLDQSLVRAATSSFGAILVALAGMGFTLFGIYSVVSARHRVLKVVG